MRRKFIAGNWKMNKTAEEGAALTRELVKALADSRQADVAVCPPFVYLQQVGAALQSSHIALGSQDVYFEQKGAFTGEISSAMLKDVGCAYAICGHSERRHVIGETDELINKKVHAAILGGLLPILCVGELIEERKANKTTEVVTRQMKKGLAGLSAEKMSAVTIAYEPVWAIGTGLTATPQQAQEVHAMIRKLVAQMYDRKIADAIRIQYGGSVKADNAGELMAQEDLDDN